MDKRGPGEPLPPGQMVGELEQSGVPPASGKCGAGAVAGAAPAEAECSAPSQQLMHSKLLAP